ncbi:hypothetical protein CI41S_39560 [Bradyrhizobium ivorense]|nr:hypothetical protein CI41S_39560 [Bradyrhizobium ivorense]
MTALAVKVRKNAIWQCQSCDGTGIAMPYCEDCDGLGIVPRAGHCSTKCTRCGGAKCDDCKGTGQIP